MNSLEIFMNKNTIIIICCSIIILLLASIAYILLSNNGTIDGIPHGSNRQPNYNTVETDISINNLETRVRRLDEDISSKRSHLIHSSTQNDTPFLDASINSEIGRLQSEREMLMEKLKVLYQQQNK
jgi:predicted mannosyl-3-phosphoglycerate phosphatase (HAD superfamily)